MVLAIQTTTPYAIATTLTTHQTTPQPTVNSHLGGTKSMKPEEIHEIIQQAVQAWISGDADAFARLFTPDGLFIVPGHRWVGPSQIRQVTAEFTAAHSVKIEIHQILIQGDRAVVEWFWEETNKTTGSHQKAEDAIAIDFKDGKITRWREYIDTQTFSQ